MCWWCPELCWAPKQQGGNWLLLSNSPEARQRGELQPGTLEQCHENWNSFSFFLLIWIIHNYPLLWVSAGGQCYLKTWLSSKALTRMLHTRNTDRKIAISPLVHWTGLPLLNTKGTISLSACSPVYKQAASLRNNLIICGCLYYLEADLGRQRLRTWSLFAKLGFFWAFHMKNANIKAESSDFCSPLKIKDQENYFS